MENQDRPRLYDAARVSYSVQRYRLNVGVIIGIMAVISLAPLYIDQLTKLIYGVS